MPPRPYADPTLDWVHGALSEGVEDPNLLVDPQWSPQEKKRFADRFVGFRREIRSKGLAGPRVPDAPPDVGRLSPFQREQALQQHARSSEFARRFPPFVGDAAAGLYQGGVDLVASGARSASPAMFAANQAMTAAGVNPDLAERLNKHAGEVEAVRAQAATADAVPDDLQTAVGGTARSLATMIPLAATGSGQVGIIAGFANSRGNQAITEADQAGLKGRDKWGYVGRAAANEALWAGLFAGAGKLTKGAVKQRGGAEALAADLFKKAGPGASEGARRSFVRELFGELAEENITEILDAHNQAFSGVTGEVTPEQHWEILKQTTLQTILTMGLLHGSNAAKRQIAKRLSASYGWSDEESLAVVDRAAENTKRPQDAEAALGAELALTPEGMARWAILNPQAARALAGVEGDTPSRSEWEASGLPAKRIGSVRAQALSDLRDVVGALDEAVRTQGEQRLDDLATQQARAEFFGDQPPPPEFPPASTAEATQRYLESGRLARQESPAQLDEPQPGVGPNVRVTPAVPAEDRPTRGMAPEILAAQQAEAQVPEQPTPARPRGMTGQTFTAPPTAPADQRAVIDLVDARPGRAAPRGLRLRSRGQPAAAEPSVEEMNALQAEADEERANDPAFGGRGAQAEEAQPEADRPQKVKPDRSRERKARAVEAKQQAVVFASGLTSSPKDIDEAMNFGEPIGVAAFAKKGTKARATSANVKAKLADYANSGGLVFVDSGAFSSFTGGNAQDWQRVRGEYGGVFAQVDEENRGNVYVVAPDVVGDQGATLDLQTEMWNVINEWENLGLRVIVPVQAGAKDLSAAWADATDNLLRAEDAVIGVPYNEAAYDQADVLDYIARQNELATRQDPAVIRMHLLGGGRDKVNALVDAVAKQKLDNVRLELGGDSLYKAASGRKRGKSAKAAEPEPEPKTRTKRRKPKKKAEAPAPKPKNKGRKIDAPVEQGDEPGTLRKRRKPKSQRDEEQLLSYPEPDFEVSDLADELDALAREHRGLEEEAKKRRTLADNYATMHKLRVTRGRNKGDLKKSKSLPKQHRRRYGELDSSAKEAESRARMFQASGVDAKREALEKAELASLVNDELAPRLSRLAARKHLHSHENQATPAELQRALDEASELFAREVYGDATDAEVKKVSPRVAEWAGDRAREGKHATPEALKIDSRLRPQLDVARERMIEIATYGYEQGVYNYGRDAPSREANQEAWREIDQIRGAGQPTREDVAKAKALIDAEAKAIAERKKQAEADAKAVAEELREEHETRQAKFREVLEGDLGGKITDLRERVNAIRQAAKQAGAVGDEAEPRGVVKPQPILKSPKRVSEALRAVENHAHKENTRYAMRGVHVAEHKGERFAVATDGKRLIVVPYDGDFEAGKTYHHLPPAPLNALKFLSGAVEHKASLQLAVEGLGVSDKAVKQAMGKLISLDLVRKVPGGGYAITRPKKAAEALELGYTTIDGHFPPWHEVLPKKLDERPGRIEVTPEFAGTLRGAAMVGRAASKPAVKADPRRKIEAEKAEDVHVMAYVELPGGEVAAFSATYLADALDDLARSGHEPREILLGEKASEPLVVTTDNPSALSLVMPMNLYGYASQSPLNGTLRIELQAEAREGVTKAKPKKARKRRSQPKPSKGAMSVFYQGPPPAPPGELFADPPGLNVGTMNRMLRLAGGKEPAVYPELSGGAVGRFSTLRGIMLDKHNWIGPIVPVSGADLTPRDPGVVRDRGDGTILVRGNGSVVEAVRVEMVEEVLDRHPELDEDGLDVKVEPDPKSDAVRVTIRKIDPTFAAKVFGHEIGHWVDWMPDKTMARGNILGRLATLRRYLKSTLDESGQPGLDKNARARLRRRAEKAVGERPPRGTAEDTRWLRDMTLKVAQLQRESGLLLKTDVEAELRALTMWWNPFDPAADAKYTRYRHSPPELYAEALSVLLNKPAELRQRAPLFHATFFDLLERKPEVRDAYQQIVDEVSSGVVYEKVLADIYEGYRRGEEEIRKKAERPSVEFDTWHNSLGTLFVDRFWLLHRLVEGARKSGLRFVNPIQIIDLAKYTDSLAKEYRRRLEEVILKLEEANVTEQDFGFYLGAMRAKSEGFRKAIPTMGDQAGLEGTVAAFERAMGPAKLAALEEARQDYRAVRDELILSRLEESGVYSEGFMDYLKANEFYARYEVVDYIQRKGNYAGGLGMIAREGTVKDVANPLTATVDKDLSLLHTLTWNNARRAVVDFMVEAGLPATPAPMAWDTKSKTMKPAEPKDETQGLLVFMRGGTTVGYHVPKTVANMFAPAGKEVSAAAGFLRPPAHAARVYLTILRLGFQLSNILFRDPQRTIANLKGARPWNIYPELIRSLIATWKEEVRGEVDTTNVKMRNRGLLIERHVLAEPDAETTELNRQLSRYQEEGTWKSKVFWPVQRYLRAMYTLGTVGETANKRAAFVFLEKNGARLGFTDEEVDHAIRHWVGSPSFVTGGTATPVSNNTLLFSNATVQGWRSDLEVLRKDPWGSLGRRLLYNMAPTVFKLSLATGLASALFGFDDDDEEDGGYLRAWVKGMERMFGRVSKYDLANYNVIPVAETEGGKTVYLRLPLDETDRLVTGMLTKALTGDNVLVGAQDAARYAGDQVPGWNPAWTLVTDVWSYMKGENPYDDFRERPAVPKEIFERGGAESHKRFAEWLYNRYGPAFIHKIPYETPGEVRTNLDEVLGLPALSDTLGRFVKVSDYGVKQEYEEAKKEARKARTGRKLDIQGAVDRKVEGAPQEGDAELLDANPVAARRRERAVRAKAAGPLASALEFAASSEEKAAILRRARELDPGAQGLEEAVQDFAGQQLYTATLPRIVPRRAETAEGRRDAMRQREADRERAVDLLRGLLPKDPSKALQDHWLKRHGALSRDYTYRLQAALRLVRELREK